MDEVRYKNIIIELLVHFVSMEGTDYLSKAEGNPYWFEDLSKREVDELFRLRKIADEKLTEKSR